MNSEQPNLNYISELSGGDKEFEAKMLSILKSELPEEVNTYNNHVEKQDFKQIAEIVHKIKHKISILGLEKSYESAVAYEKELLEGDMKGHTDFLELLTKMSNFLDNA
ncbi:Hpt domain-containing protein [Tenacibaculum jejuense]|uniref:Probable two-component system. Phosphotransfer protein (HPt) n=1 Tax=Tenacibaculum jejuense TaxID=584609 RepID=A0A238UBC0_9FLAO|nr:Hpt domain-containing protein [Tenacibaculum jejuense]SNR16503.1 Probable two-component system. Phosphotransfer protein (HPt) [Tenacibaculum jejuense]